MRPIRAKIFAALAERLRFFEYPASCPEANRAQQILRKCGPRRDLSI
jgi:hypothetical protein